MTRARLVVGLLMLGPAGCGASDDEGGASATDAGMTGGEDITGGAPTWAPPPDEPYTLTELPAGWPRPFIPEDEPLTRPCVELGRHLFYDVRLSGNETQACASCHDQARAFTEDRPTSQGSTGEDHFRNAMSLTNAGYVSALTWASRLVGSLSEQALMPMFGEAPVELGLAGLEDTLLERLRAEPRYQALFPLCRPGAGEAAFSLDTVTAAIASFQRTLLSYRSPYDRFTYYGEMDALDAPARAGMELFFSERFECFHCHRGFTFSSGTRTETTTLDETSFHNTGLYNLGPDGAYPAVDTGLSRITLDPAEMGRFRAPTLRNIARTAPYFHDGSAATLDDVLDHYDRGGRLIETGPNAGDGAASPFKDPFVHAIDMTADERAALRAFLEALTDEHFLTDARFANPWPPGSPSGPKSNE